ncbi:hypothetical protein A8A04_24405 [Escherichia coli]|nr:hypothetical protein A8A04_24405 [Escherichia coli]
MDDWWGRPQLRIGHRRYRKADVESTYSESADEDLSVAEDFSPIGHVVAEECSKACAQFVCLLDVELRLKADCTVLPIADHSHKEALSIEQRILSKISCNQVRRKCSSDTLEPAVFRPKSKLPEHKTGLFSQVV